MARKSIKSFVAGDDLNRKIASEAAKRKMSISKYLNEVMNLYFSLDQDKLEQVIKISRFLDLEIPEVVNAMLRIELNKIVANSNQNKKR